MLETRVVVLPEPGTLPRRRRVLSQWLGLALAGLALAPDPATAGLLPDVPAGPGSASARTRLRESATAHGLAAWRQHRDLNASFSGVWSPASDWFAVGPGGAKTAENTAENTAAGAAAEAAQLRLLLAADLLAVRLGGHEAHPSVLRRQAGFGAAASADRSAATSQAAFTEDPRAVLSADAMCLLLLGPLAVLDRATAVNWGPPATLDERRCDQLVLTVTPGLGLAPESRMALFIDREVGWLRRLRWAGNGPEAGWRGLAEVDFFDHLSLQGMVWPRRFQSPSRWWLPGAQPQTGRLTGLDLDRGYGAEALAGERWTGAAAAPARPLPQA